MSINVNIPIDSIFSQLNVSFKAYFNNPLIGGYNFATDANTNVSVFHLQKSSLYFLERVSINANIDQNVYLKAISELPLVYLRFAFGNKNIFANPFTILNYLDNQETIGWIYTVQGNDRICASCTGKLTQITDLIGVPDVSLHATFNLYQIRDAAFIRDWLARGRGK